VFAGILVLSTTPSTMWTSPSIPLAVPLAPVDFRLVRSL
jgi:hypothetical protein